jgi:hypothetical protein
LNRAKSPADVSLLLSQTGITRAIGPSPAVWFAAQHAAVQGLLRACGQVEHTSGSFALWTLPTACPAAEDAVYFKNAPAAPRGEYDDTSDYARYHGYWTHDRQFAAAFGHTLTYSLDRGAYVQFRFNGQRVRIVYTAAANRGVAVVVVDGNHAPPLNQYSVETRWQASAVYEAGRSGTHVIRIQHNGGPATDAYIDIDRFIVE